MRTMKDVMNEQMIGRKADVKLNGMIFEVEVKDVKVSYGTMRYLVTPISGSGECWMMGVTLK
jgi:hypothetical protein